MEREMQPLPPTPSRGSHCSPGDGSHRYTSLRDVLLRHRYHTVLRSVLGAFAGGGRSCAGPPLSLLTTQQTICIKNRLLKHAASAYVQSANAAAAAGEAEGRRNSGVMRMWRRLRERRQESWRACMGDSFERCIGFVARSVSRALVCVVSHVGRVCARGRSSAIAT